MSRRPPGVWRDRVERDRRTITRLKARNTARERLRARFIVETAIEREVKIAIVGGPRDPTIFVFAPNATDEQRQFACERSFQDAVEANLDEVIKPAPSRWGAS
jgi:hypothetical protein